ncbi:hypothetical protein BJP36_42335 [Moorena producens JHB]|uniref:Uncharacterized protein n=1 Tax=Moorena producens (strain JHB) TaxID=1454205 RepID=A0A9Q9UVN4_MOOP1|nr:hypothetical protein [Moorena producens]WAN69004.1 hypothetical protein BJP36_42335 [Moorena producens JHB]
MAKRPRDRVQPSNLLTLNLLTLNLLIFNLLTLAKRPRDRVQPSNLKPSNLQPSNLQPQTRLICLGQLNFNCSFWCDDNFTT